MLRKQRAAAMNHRSVHARRSVSVIEIPLDEPLAAPPPQPAPTIEYAPRIARSLADLGSLTWEFLRARAESVCARVGALIAATWRCFVLPSVPLRVTVLAGFVLLACVFSARMVSGEIDLTKLMPGAVSENARPRIVVENGRLTNAGDAPALNLEITKPRYRLIGTLAPGEAIDPPADNFTVQFEYRENDQTKRATRSFALGSSARAAGRRNSETDAPGISTSPANFEASASASAPHGIAAEYDPATRLLTVRAQKAVEVRVDGFLLRPIARTDKEGGQYRYVQANILVLGQNIRQGDTVQFEVVFTKPQDFYSIPIYVREPGRPASYFTVSVSTAPQS